MWEGMGPGSLRAVVLVKLAWLEGAGKVGLEREMLGVGCTRRAEPWSGGGAAENPALQ
jgi:hypothetical protein